MFRCHRRSGAQSFVPVVFELPEMACLGNVGCECLSKETSGGQENSDAADGVPAYTCLEAPEQIYERQRAERHHRVLESTPKGNFMIVLTACRAWGTTS